MGRRSRSRRGAGLGEGRSQRWEKKLSRDRGGVRPDFVFLCGGMVILVGIIWGQGSTSVRVDVETGEIAAGHIQPDTMSLSEDIRGRVHDDFELVNFPWIH